MRSAPRRDRKLCRRSRSIATNVPACSRPTGYASAEVGGVSRALAPGGATGFSQHGCPSCGYSPALCTRPVLEQPLELLGHPPHLAIAGRVQGQRMRLQKASMRLGSASGAKDRAGGRRRLSRAPRAHRQLLPFAPCGYLALKDTLPQATFKENVSAHVSGFGSFFLYRS